MLYRPVFDVVATKTSNQDSAVSVSPAMIMPLPDAGLLRLHGAPSKPSSLPLYLSTSARTYLERACPHHLDNLVVGPAQDALAVDLDDHRALPNAGQLCRAFRLNPVHRCLRAVSFRPGPELDAD